MGVIFNDGIAPFGLKEGFTVTHILYTRSQLHKEVKHLLNIEPLMTKVRRFLGSPFYRREVYQANPVVPTVRVMTTQ
jgi:hypothetical protein